MTGNDQAAATSTSPLLRHAVGGFCQAPPSLMADTSNCVSSTVLSHEDLHTSLAVNNAVGHNFVAATTGSKAALPAGGCVLIAGQPYFRTTQLQQVAADQGAASAIATLYETEQDGVFAHVHGPFSCIIIDNQAQQTLLAVDRLGQHSLYFQAGAERLAFGTSASATQRWVQSQGPSLVNQGIFNYVYFHMVPCPVTVFDQLKKIPAAHYVRYSATGWEFVNYWLPIFHESSSGETEQTLGQELRRTLTTAVKNTLPTGGKTGAFLSGGLDSSTVTGVLSELSNGAAEAYSIGFSAEGYDEMPFARITAQHFGIRLNEYYVTPEDVVEALPMIATSYEEPFGNSSALPAYFCAKMAVENGVDTLLAGDGGDEIFAGNERYLRQQVFEHYAKVPSFLRRGLLEPVIQALPNRLPLVAKAKSYITQANTPLPDRLQSYNFLHRHAASEIFSDEYLASVDIDAPMALQRDIYRRPTNADDLNRMLYLDWQITLADNDLRKVSHMCAIAGVNVAYPMLDDSLVEFSCRIPSAWKMAQSDLRHFYKEALAGWLPEATISKSKQGFGLPFGVWMQTYQPLRDLAYDNLQSLKQRGLIKPAFIDQAIQMHQSEHAAYYGELVWILTVLELWLNAHTELSF